MAQKEITKINKASLAKIFALIYGLVGFFIAMIAAILTMSNIIMQKDFQGSVVMVTLFNIGAGLLLGLLSAFLTALVGWVAGYLMGAIYNWFAVKAGGIKIELADTAEINKENINL